MRRRLVILLGFALVLFALAPAVLAGHGNTNYTASLKVGNEVPEVEEDTKAVGQAIFKHREGDSLSFKLIVANIEGVVASHIHCGEVGVAGPVGVTLFSGGPTSNSGILAQGQITEPDAGNGCGWETLAQVIAAIESGDTYVNVHTLANPPGEIRGQIR